MNFADTIKYGKVTLQKRTVARNPGHKLQFDVSVGLCVLQDDRFEDARCKRARVRQICIWPCTDSIIATGPSLVANGLTRKQCDSASV